MFRKCGYFYCAEMYPVSDMTALCPVCGINSVVGDESHSNEPFSITVNLLKKWGSKSFELAEEQ